jgi:acyl carrier protein
MGDVKHNVKADLRELVATILEVEPDTIDEQASFVKDLGMDSMMALEVLASIEKKYKIIIPEETLAKFTSLSQTVSIVQTMLEKK